MGVRKRKVKKENRKDASDGQKGNGIPDTDKGKDQDPAIRQ